MGFRVSGLGFRVRAWGRLSVNTFVLLLGLVGFRGKISEPEGRLVLGSRS